MEVSLGSYQGRFRRHDYRVDLAGRIFLTGQSGTGKSTLMRNGFIQLVQAKPKRSVLFMDFHGNTALDLLGYIPRNRMRDVIYIDPFSDRPVSLNTLHYTTPMEKEMKIQGFLSMLKSIHRDRWGDETERIIMGALDAITEYHDQPNPLAIYLFIARSSYRKEILAHCKNPALDDFREQYEEKLKASEQMSKFSPPLNKVDEFVRIVLRAMMGQDSTIDFLEAMNNGAVIICNLNKGKLGAEVASLIGSMILSELWNAALRRDTSIDNTEFYALVDEAQNSLHGIDLESMLSESRKYQFFPFFATQYLAKIPNIQAAFGNYSTWITYRMGGTDAELLAKEFHDPELAGEIVNLPSYRFRARTIREDIPEISPEVTARKKVKKLGDEPPRGAVIEESTRHWGTDRAAVEAKVQKFLRSEGSHRPSRRTR
jgi:hypothetical protein